VPESLAPESGGVWQVEPLQTPFHCPQPLHTTEAQLGHTELGVQTGGAAQEHAPHAHVTEHTSPP